MKLREIIGKAALGMALGTLGGLVGARVVDDLKVNRIWRELAAAPGTDETFTEAMLAGLPEPAQRYFMHAIRPGTRLARRLEWTYTGAMKPGKQGPEMALRARQIIVSQRGFVWKVFAHNGPVIMTAADHYHDGRGQMRIYAYGLVPVINAEGPDTSRSALGRLLVECIAVPASILPGPYVKIEAVDDSHFRAVVHAQGEVTALTIAVDGEGRVEDLSMPRWGDQTGDGHFEYIPYGARMEEERTFGGYTIPSRIKVYWWYGTEREQEQIRLAVDEAKFS